MGLFVKNLNDIIAEGTVDLYMPEIEGFKSMNNPDVETFLKDRAVQFCRMKQAVTYLVVDDSSDLIAAYFTLAFKIMEFPLESLSNSMLRVLERNGTRTESAVQVPGMLLAQWSKNFAFDNRVSGRLVMELVEREFLYVQNKIGGVFAFLECESEKARLLEHYRTLGYTPIAERLSRDNVPLVQFIKKI